MITRYGVAIAIGFALTASHIAIFDYLAAGNLLSGTLFLPLWFRVVFTNLVFALAIALIFLAKSNRERYLSLLFLTIAYSFADSSLLFHLRDSSDQIYALFIERIALEAATPLVIWLFFKEFPKSTINFQYHWVFDIGIKISATAFLGLALLHLGGWQKQLPIMDRADSSSLYWGLIFGLALPSLPLFALKARKSVTEEKYRVQAFTAAMVTCMVPIFLFILYTLDAENRAWVLSDRIRPWAISFNLFFLTLSIGAAAYTVFASDVLELSKKLNMASRYTMATVITNLIAFSPALLACIYLWEMRTHPLVESINSIPASLALSITLLQGFLLYLKSKIQTQLLRAFFRDRPTPERLMQITTHLLATETKEQLSERFADIMMRDFQISQAALLLTTQDQHFEDRSGELTSAPTLLLEDILSNDASSNIWIEAESLNQDSTARIWLGKNNLVMMLALRHAATDDPIGLLVLGKHKGQITFSSQDKEQLKTIARICEYRLSNLSLVNEGTPKKNNVSSGYSLEHANYCLECSAVTSLRTSSCPFCESHTEPASLPAIVSNRYRLQKLLGNGAEGTVFLGTDIFLNRLVAIKSLNRNSGANGARLMREARLVASISHPGLAQIYGADYYQETPFIIFEYMREGTLREKIDKLPLSTSELGVFMQQVETTLSYLHNRGYIHGDLKPENIGYLSEHEVKLLDFGIARLQGVPSSGANDDKRTSVLENTTSLGTTAYLSPAAIRGGAIDHRNDYWSLGVTAYEAATGIHPFRRTTAQQTRRAILKTSPEHPLALNPALDQSAADRIMALLNYDQLPIVPGVIPE